MTTTIAIFLERTATSCPLLSQATGALRAATLLLVPGCSLRMHTPQEASENTWPERSSGRPVASLYASVRGSPMRTAAVTENHYTVTSSPNPPGVDDKIEASNECNLLLFAYASDDNEDLELHPTKIAVFECVYEETRLEVLICSTFGVLPGVSRLKEQEVLRALFRVTQDAGEAFAQCSPSASPPSRASNDHL